MEPFSWLLLLSAAMFIGSYVAGSLPLSTKLSEQTIKYFNALAAGLLIGTSLMVVIPEGVETIYSSASNPNPDKRSPDESGGEHGAVGLALLIGFAVMFMIDQLSSLHLTSAAPVVEYTELGVVGREEEARDSDTQSIHQAPSMTPTIGLVVHATADGIALGASASHPQLSVVVFLAIMLHKAPSSFALTSVLLASGLSYSTIRKHLLLFALAAPLGAIITFAILSFFSAASQTLEYWTGVLLVFSGGTFLYVAMHALQDVSHSDHHRGKNRLELGIILVGMVIPILLSLTHSH